MIIFLVKRNIIFPDDTRKIIFQCDFLERLSLPNIYKKKIWFYMHSFLEEIYIFLPKMNAYRRDFNKTKCISFLTKDEKLLKKHNEIWKKVRNIIKK